jgi:hypothetical protein
MALRLCEVRPDGRSWLVTWAVINLNRHASPASPRELGPGIDELTIDLRPIAHRFRAGSRIRLSLSEGWWPMVWPTPQAPTFRIASGISVLELPFRRVEAAPAQLPMAEHIGEGPAFDLPAPVSPDPDGKVRLHTAVPRSTRQVPGADIELTSRREEMCEMIAGDPLSSQWRQRVYSAWRRGDWHCSVEASYELACDADAFRLRESLHAIANGEDVIKVANETRIPRDYL